MQKVKILMIEDERDVLEINREYFEGKGYETICAATLSQARVELEKHKPDLILLDIMMPDGTGLDFCTELRKKQMLPSFF